MKTIEAIDVLVNEMIHDVLAPNYKGWIVADETTAMNMSSLCKIKTVKHLVRN